MRNFLINIIDTLVLFLGKIRYKLLKDYVDPASTDLLLRWKKAYPEKFGAKHTIVTQALVDDVAVSDNIDDIINTPHKEL